MVKCAVLAVVIGACHTLNPAFCPSGVGSDGECLVGDGGGVDARACFGSAGQAFCVTKPPTMPLTLTHVDTTNGCDETNALGCVVEGTDVTLSEHVTVRGTRPLVLLATGTLTISASGILDATGTTSVGGGGADIACKTDGVMATSSGGDGAGGAGGSFASRGGNGGNGGGGTSGGTAASTTIPIALQGGCSGTAGGNGDPNTGGLAGFGGGGVYLVAGEQLTILGTINASGSGGGGGLAMKGGGGGGGSGGMIVLSAPMVTVQASTQIFANGGGGGGGGAGGNGTAGTTPSAPSTVAGGGPGSSMGNGGTGGNGAFGATAPQPGATSGAGGGGGGGGIGVIYVLGGGDISGAAVSPMPS